MKDFLNVLGFSPLAGQPAACQTGKSLRIWALAADLSSDQTFCGRPVGKKVRSEKRSPTRVQILKDFNLWLPPGRRLGQSASESLRKSLKKFELLQSGNLDTNFFQAVSVSMRQTVGGWGGHTPSPKEKNLGRVLKATCLRILLTIF